MSKKQAIAFFEEISKNKQLAQEVEKVVKGKNSDEAKAKELISLAKKHNFIFTPEDAQNAQEALKKPLSPEEMLEVSGGKMNLKSSVMAAAMLFGLGVGGTAMSSMKASAMKRAVPPEYLEYSDSSSKSGKDENGQPRRNGNRSQTQPATTEAANSRQNETPPSNGQGAAQSDSQQTTRGTPHSRPRTTSGEELLAPRSPREEKKAWPNREHDNEAAARFGGIAGCNGQFLGAVRGLSGNGYLPNADWPAVPQFEHKGDGKKTCRYCKAKLTNGKDPFCKNPDCIFPWTFRSTSAKRQTSQRPVDSSVCARWALLPALILDSRYGRISSTGTTGRKGTNRKLAIETPAEAWAVWQLIVWHNNGWADVRTMMAAHNVDPTIQTEVVRLLDESYDNLVLGNESFIDLGSEVQQLVVGHITGWQNFIGAMVERGYGSEEVKQAFTMMINSYYLLTDKQLQQTGYNPTQIPRNPEDALAEIKAAHQRFEIAMQKAEDARKTVRRQAIEKLQRGETLSIEQARAIAPMLKCGSKTCGNIGATVKKNRKGSIYFHCKRCNAPISNLPDDLLAMLQEATPENVPMEMADAEQDEQQMQFEIQPMQMNQGEGPTYEIKFHRDAAPQMSMQGMNQFNPGQQMMTHNHNDLDNTFYYEPIEPYQLQTGDPNDFTFNMGHSHAPIHHHLTVYQMDGSQQPVNVQMQNMDQMNGQQQNTQFAQNQQPMNDQSDLTFDQTQILQQNSDHNFQFDYIGDYVNALNTATQELAQCNNMLTTITDNPLFANVEMVRNVVASAQAVIAQVEKRFLDQSILNMLGASERYLTAAQAFSDQLEIFNNMLDMIGKQRK